MRICAILGHGTSLFSLAHSCDCDEKICRTIELLRKGEAFSHRFTPLVCTSLLLGNDRGDIRQAAISEATGDLGNLPGLILHSERELKVPLVIIAVPVGSYRLEQQVPDRR